MLRLLSTLLILLFISCESNPMEKTDDTLNTISGIIGNNENFQFGDPPDSVAILQMETRSSVWDPHGTRLTNHSFFANFSHFLSADLDQIPYKYSSKDYGSSITYAGIQLNKQVESDGYIWYNLNSSPQDFDISLFTNIYQSFTNEDDGEMKSSDFLVNVDLKALVEDGLSITNIDEIENYPGNGDITLKFNKELSPEYGHLEFQFDYKYSSNSSFGSGRRISFSDISDEIIFKETQMRSMKSWFNQLLLDFIKDNVPEIQQPYEIDESKFSYGFYVSLDGESLNTGQYVEDKDGKKYAFYVDQSYSHSVQLYKMKIDQD
jgi:hypothetical protein